MSKTRASDLNPLPAFGRSGVWRAQLLWMLEAAKGDPIAIGQVLGFCEEREASTNHETANVKDVQDLTDFSRPPPAIPSARPAVRFFYVERNTLDASAATAVTVDEPDWYAASTVLPEESAPERGSVPHPAYQDVQYPARFNPFLRRQLGAKLPGNQLDLRRLLHSTERGELLRHLPVLARQTWAPTVQLLLDLSTGTQPFYRDFHAVVADLQAKRGGSGLRVSVLADGPGRYPWVKERRGRCRRFNPPDGQTPLLILSDLGAGEHAGGDLCVRIGWEAFGRQLRAAGCRPIVLCPAPPQSLTPVLRQLFSVYYWDRRATLKWPVKSSLAPDERGQSDRAAYAEAVLTLGAPAIFLEPALIRALRLLVSGADTATEGAVWWHADVCHGSGAAVAYAGLDVRTRYQARFRNLPPALQRQAVDAIRLHHANQAESIRLIEAETASRLMDQCDATAAVWHANAARTLLEAETPAWAAWRTRHLNRQSAALWAGNRPLAALWVSANAEALLAGESVPRPDQLDETDLAFFLGIRAAPRIRSAFLRQIGSSLVLDAVTTGPGAVLAEFRLDTDTLRVDLSGAEDGITTTLVPVTQLPRTLAHLTTDLGQIVVRGLAQQLYLSSLLRPHWARAIGRDENGLYVVLQLEGERQKVGWPVWASAFDLDAFGLYADFTVKGITQRCRWIAPGTFQMGSPLTEVKRVKNEALHEVTLSHGYWLADTACPQALWQAVMLDNPSNFNDDSANPVEQVSWNDVQAFLARLNAFVPGLDAGLPSEAQWENACRAGTTTPFSQGESITPWQVNYRGNYPYAGGKKGLFRKRTVPIKSLPPNPWGLYEMHGNVWEWCSDWCGEYPEVPQTDPVGPPKGFTRVLRGGAWCEAGEDCRAASRTFREPALRNVSFGFRLAPGKRSGPAGQDAALRADGQAQKELAGQAAVSDTSGRGTSARSKKRGKKP